MRPTLTLMLARFALGALALVGLLIMLGQGGVLDRGPLSAAVALHDVRLAEGLGIDGLRGLVGAFLALGAPLGSAGGVLALGRRIALPRRV
jgi:hypothetical protein